MNDRARGALLEAALVTLALGGWIVAVEQLGRVVDLFAGMSGALVALGFLVTPLLLAKLGRADGDPYGAGPGNVGRALAIGLAAAVVVLLPFAVGYDQVATRVWGEQRFAGPGLPSRGLALQGATPAPARPLPGAALAIWEQPGGVALRNDGAVALQLEPTCAGCRARPLPPGALAQLAEPAASAIVVRTVGGAALPPAAVRQGRFAVPAEATPLSAPASLWWIVALLLDQVVVVALPEEVLFRGWMLGRLRAALPPRRQLWGVPFGAAHVACAACFALVHLAATPAPSRLLVFFPALLFAWLAERARHIAAPVVHHALSNVTLQLLGRLYG